MRGRRTCRRCSRTLDQKFAIKMILAVAKKPYRLSGLNKRVGWNAVKFKDLPLLGLPVCFADVCWPYELQFVTTQLWKCTGSAQL